MENFRSRLKKFRSKGDSDRDYNVKERVIRTNKN